MMGGNRGLLLAVVVVMVALSVAPRPVRCGLLLQRPDQDCINPSVGKVNEFNFFPDETRATRVIAERSPNAPGAEVR